VLLPSSLPPSSRWRNHTTFLSKEEIEDIFNVLQNHFHQSINPAELIQSLIKENQEITKTIEEMKNQLQNIQNEKEKIENQLQNIENENGKIKQENVHLKNETDKIKQENVQLKYEKEKLTLSVQQKHEEIKKSGSNAIQVNLSGSNGIISSLRQNDPNPVLLTSSSNDSSSCPPENILKRDDNYWISKNEQNSWILFNFKNKQISPSGYLIRNKADGNYIFSPQGWKLEGSNDQSKWITIHEVQDCQKFRSNDQEASFSCQTDQFFSFLRFTQTQENLMKFHG
jgi:DNA gyrase/topoisomerase IV subunit A